MKSISSFIYLILFCFGSIYSQNQIDDIIKIKQYNKAEIEDLLSLQFNSQVINIEVTVDFVEDLHNNGAGPYKLYYRVHEPCGIICFTVVKDEKGVKYLGKYYVPQHLIKQKVDVTSNKYGICYIQDKWLGGPSNSHFDSFAIAKYPSEWEKSLFLLLFE